MAGRQLTIGRSGDVEIDDNPYLHRNFLAVLEEGGLWWLSNVGSTLTATVADDTGLFQAWLAPGARIPLALNRILVWFTAGPTTYDFEIIVDNPAFVSVAPEPLAADYSGEMTVGRVSFTADQKLLMVALCERLAVPQPGPGTSQIPSSAAAAARIGWTVTRFNRKLDNVCQKLADAGTRGLHGGIGKLASNRKSRLVEHALSTRLVTVHDLKPCWMASAFRAESATTSWLSSRFSVSGQGDRDLVMPSTQRRPSRIWRPSSRAPTRRPPPTRPAVADSDQFRSAARSDRCDPSRRPVVSGRPRSCRAGPALTRRGDRDRPELDAPSTVPGRAGFTSGVTISVIRLRWSFVDVGRPAAVAVIVAGPDSGKEFALSRGTAYIGRGHGCEIQVSDSSVSRRHAKLLVAEHPPSRESWTSVGQRDLGWRGRGAAGGPQERAGDRVRLGDTGGREIRFATGDAPWPSSGDCASVAFSRSPRIAPLFEGREHDLPSFASERPKPSRMPWLCFPALLGAGMFAFTRSPYSLMFVLMSPMMMLGNHLEQSRGGRKEFEKLMRGVPSGSWSS